MGFDFFTFGGGQFWEDVFYYQKWRIQRNFESKKYRLLDPWDIRRHSGSFEDCRLAFLRLIEAYELQRQKGHMIIMLHGLGETKNIFRPVWHKAMDEGFAAAAINYPSCQKHFESHVRQVQFLLDHLEDIDTVSFIGKGVGALILREVLSRDGEWKKNLKIGRVVQVCPPNKGSKLFEKMAKWRFWRFIFGPMLAELAPDKVKNLPKFAKDIEVGIIDCPFEFKKISKYLPQKWQNLWNEKNSASLSGDNHFIRIKNRNFNVFNNKKVTDEAVYFIKNGRFEKNN